MGRSEGTGVRRSPVQERGQETVEQVLAAASALLAKMPLSQITTSRIAAKAKVSVGGLYRFFPDKQAIVDAIAVRALEQFQGTVERRMREVDSFDGRVLLEVMIDAYVEFLQARPEFRAIALGRHVSALTRQAHVEGSAGPAALVKMFLNGADPDLKLNVAIEAGERLVDFAFEQRSAEERDRVITEMKRLLGGYLFGG